MKGISFTLALALAATGSSSALAQAIASPAEAASERSASGLEDIVVTANRRAESVQKVPISISVISNTELTAAGVSTATQLQTVTTNLQIGSLAGQPLFTIRGMGTNANIAGVESPVSLYLDGIYLPWATAIDQNFLDVERVEVLKGPQGSLYGRNTTAGAINFYTRDPSKARAIEGLVTIGTKNTKIFSTYLASGPGKVAGSIAAAWSKHGAYMKSLGTGPDLNNRNEISVRGKLRFELGDAWTATLSADWGRRKDDGANGFVNVASVPPAPGARYATMDNPGVTYGDFPGFGEKYKNYGGSLIVRGELGFADFVSLSGARRVSLWATPHADASDLDLTAFSALSKLKNWSQEFQLISTHGGPLEWVVGIYAFHSEGGLSPAGVFLQGYGNRGPSVDEADIVLSGLGSTKAYAGYGEAKYALTDNLRLTAGLRYSWEERTLDESQVSVPALGNLVVQSEQPDKTNWNSLTPKIGLDYSWDGSMLYATYTKGFRSGSFNYTSPGTPGPVNPEKVHAFEVGGKHSFFDGMRFNWSAFYYKYSDLQVTRNVNQGTGSLFLTENAASAKIKGVEADLILNPVENLTINLGAAYTDAKYKDYDGASAFLPSPTGFGLIQTGVNLSGRPLSRAPEWTVTSTVNYTIPIGESNLDLSGNIYWTDDYYVDTGSNVLVKSYAVINTRATFRLPDDRISVAAFVNNLTNKRYINASSSNNYSLIALPSDPRIIGVSVGFKY